MKYKPIPVSAGSLLRGTIVNSYGDGEFVPGLTNVVYPEIRRVQRRKWQEYLEEKDECGRMKDEGGDKRLDAIHSVIKLSDPPYNRWRSVTVPRAEEIELDFSPDRHWSVHEYKFLSYFDGLSWAAFAEMDARLAGRGYDYLELLKLWVMQWGWNPLPQLDLGKERTVCSVGCVMLLMAAWRSLRDRHPMAGDDGGASVSRWIDEIRPVPHRSEEYPFWAEQTYPCDFAMLERLYAQPWRTW